MIQHDEWEWLGYPQHFICADRCGFRLATRIGDKIISTVGDLRLKPGEPMETLGAWEKSFFETFIFETNGKRAKCGCCYERSSSEVWGERCATAQEASAMHMGACHAVAKGELPS